MTHRYGMSALGALAVLVATAAPAAAQSDARWLAFVGCWEPVGDLIESGILCVEQADDGVELYTLVDGEVETSDLLVANGQRRETTAEGCEGWESSEFSADRRRVFTRSEFVCEGEVPRNSTGVMALVTPNEWVDVRSVDFDGEAVAWVQRYRLVGPERMLEEGVDDFTQDRVRSLREARLRAAYSIDFDDIEEAAAAVDAKAVEAWIAARGEQMEVDAETLVRLADAGVSDGIIDVVVAVSFPNHFAIDATASASARPADRDARPGRRIYGYGPRSYFWDPFYYGYGSPYSFGRGFYGYPYGGYYYTPTTVVIDRIAPGSRGRVLNGRGYRRGDRGSTAGSAPSSTSGGAATSGGSSGGRSSGGRTARRRGGGGL